MHSNQGNILETSAIVLKIAADTITKAGFEKCNWAALKNEQAIDFIDNIIGSTLKPLIDSAQKALIDPAQGLAVIDIPSIEGIEQATDMWIGSLIALIISKRIYSIRIDPNTSLPFTIYNASSEGEYLLKKNGIKYYSPEQNLGFHTDGIVSDNLLWSPNFVSIYNVYLGYKKPGNFHWIPFSRWDEFDKWKQELASKRFTVEITPITYRHANTKLEVTSQGEFEVSLMRVDGDHCVPFFNGEVTACVSDSDFEIEKVKRMLISLSTNKTCISTPLRPRRLFVLNNWLGAHARDIFKEPLENVKYTRSFFRMMSKEAACA
jgi:hypothetical protein